MIWVLLILLFGFVGWFIQDNSEHKKNTQRVLDQHHRGLAVWTQRLVVATTKADKDLAFREITTRKKIIQGLERL